MFLKDDFFVFKSCLVSGIPFLEDVEEKSPSSDEVDERCTYSISREDELMSWPKNLHILDPIPKNCC